MIFAAIDPGAVSAAIAVFHRGTPVMTDDIRTLNNMVDAVAFARALQDMKVKQVVIENVHSMPGQGVASTFKFGMGTGIIHGVCGALRLPMALVSPTSWKGYFNLKAEKEQARELAVRKWPHLHDRLERRKDANRAEALLIGEYYWHRVLENPDPEKHDDPFAPVPASIFRR